MRENSDLEAERRNGIITDKVIMTSFGPLVQQSALRLGAPERGAGKTIGFD